MTQSDKVQIQVPEHIESSSQRGSTGTLRHTLPGAADRARLAELESENSRLQLLVAELLIKNQQLRKAN